jgi:hypothetical protein
MRDRANARRELPVVQRSAMGIEPGEFPELHRGARHDEAAAGVFVGRIVAVRPRAQKRNPVFIFEDGSVLEREGVALETEGGCKAAALRQRDKNANPEYLGEYPPVAANHFTNGSRQLRFCLRRNCPVPGIFRSVS